MPIVHGVAVVVDKPLALVYAEVATRRAGASVDDDALVALTHASGVTSHLWMSVVAAQAGPRLRGARGSRRVRQAEPRHTGERPQGRSASRRSGLG
jgi:predicted dehydrogenase